MFASTYLIYNYLAKIMLHLLHKKRANPIDPLFLSRLFYLFPILTHSATVTVRLA